MQATNVDQTLAGSGVADAGAEDRGPAASPGDLTRWLLSHTPPGRIACVGAPFVTDLDPGSYQVVPVTDLMAGEPGTFDHAWVNDFLTIRLEPVAAARRLFELVRAGGTLVLTVPFGLTVSARNGQAFYLASLRRLIEPLFDVADMFIVQDRIAVVGHRREAPVGVPTSYLDPEEIAFLEHQRGQNARLVDLSTGLVSSGARYRSMETRADRLQAELLRVHQEVKQLRGRLVKFDRRLRIPLAVLRRLRRLKRAVKRRIVRGGSVVKGSVATSQWSAKEVTTVAAPTVQAGVAMPVWRSVLRDNFQRWLTTARQAPGDEVVVMFSGTTFVQEHRGNRPIRLTNVYLDRHCPVFFNYYRAGDKEALPQHPDPLLFQSPIDATQSFLDDLLTADFGDKKRIFYVSFPHEIMVRYMMLAAQHGWVTVYDTRDDWEEFAKVGMAKWYAPSYERYVARLADVVTAVSRPLARKIEVVSGGREVHVVPNALDTRFPRPSGPRTPEVRRPVIGYFGHLTDKWFDWPLVITAAQRYPNYRFELAGHQYPADLKLPSNIELLGLVGHAELAERSRFWSVALIPFKNGPLADAVDPIKIYEYLHLRVPVLTTYFPQCRDYPGTTITEGKEEFIEQLGKLVGTELGDGEVASWLAAHTWEARVDRYSELADEVRRRGRDRLATVVGGAL